MGVPIWNIELPPSGLGMSKLPSTSGVLLRTKFTFLVLSLEDRTL